MVAVLEINDIKTGDSFICTGKKGKLGIFRWFIRRAGLSNFVHAGTFFWEGRHLMCAEVRINDKYNNADGFYITPFDLRKSQLESLYGGVYAVRHKNNSKATEAQVIDTIKGFEGSRYGYLKVLPVALNIRFKTKGAVCSTIPQKVCELMGHTASNWHPSDIFENGWLKSQIL